MEGEIAGFGASGTSEDPQLAAPGRLHGGSTCVSYGEWMGRTGFLHGSRLTAEVLKAAAARRLGRTEASLHRFVLLDRETQAYDIRSSPSGPGLARPILLQQSHPDQAMISFGDSGGPLFFRAGATGKLHLAGISSTFETTFLVDQPCRPATTLSLASRLCSVEVWEPVMGHLAWIRGIQERAQGTHARTLELGSARAADWPPVTFVKTPEG